MVGHNVAVMDNDNWNYQIPLSMIVAIGLKMFKCCCHGQRQLELSNAAVYDNGNRV